MVDLVSQYKEIKPQVDLLIQEVLDSARFIGGPLVKQFENELSDHLKIDYVHSCANGTDALQIALMALELKPGDEVIVPAFTYAATAEVIALLNLSPVMIDVEADTFNTTASIIETAITAKTKAIIPVHLFGQCTDMEDIMVLANKHNLFVIEDNAQAIGAKYSFKDGSEFSSGGIGHIGTTSFFPSKNLGCYGDGGAIFTNDASLSKKISMIANHGQSERYYHSMIGVNSRLDALQAAVLLTKLKKLDEYESKRQKVANLYDDAFKGIDQLHIPERQSNSTHVFHQYTLRVLDGLRDELRDYLESKNIPSMMYYPVPLYKQKAYSHYWTGKPDLPITERLCNEVLSLPIHTEMNDEVQMYIIDMVLNFFKNGN